MPAATPQITLAGNVEDLFGVLLADALIVVQLCNFGKQVPRIAGTAIIANILPDAVDCVAGAYNFKLWGNDVITPAGTFYTISLCNANGDVVQTNAYQFAGTQNYDLSSLVPFDPAPFVPPVPPANPPNTMDVVVPFDANAVFNALNTLGIVEFEMVLTGDVVAPTLINVTPGQIVTFLLQQDGVGGRKFPWPAQVHGGAIIDPAPGAISVESFIVRSDGNLYNITPLMVN